MKWIALLLVLCGLAAAQQPSKPLAGKPWDLGVWASGGLSVPGGTKDTRLFNAGVRLGKVLTGEHFGSFLRGQFEWSADLMPIYYLWQPAPTRNAYGAAFNPINFKWNFTSLSRTVPFLELGSGVLFTNTDVPADTSRVNFASHGAFGFHFFNNGHRAITASVRYEHISNAGLTSPNPGINTVQFLVGMNWFK